MIPILSFCIPVYNQKSELEQCISKILEYNGNDIEIVVSDNASNENIPELIEKINDPRIKYYRNNNNIGYNPNILQVLKNAKAPHVFLLRTRDHIIPSAIPKVIQILKNKPNISYITGTALNELGEKRLSYSKHYYSKGREALDAHFKMYIHPSGSIYAIHPQFLIDLEEILTKVDAIKPNTVIHVLLRLYLSQVGDFEIIEEPLWVYTNTYSSKKPATNTCNNHSPYLPQYQRNLFEQEFHYIHLHIKEEIQMKVYLETFKRYFWSTTYGFKLQNTDSKHMMHYSCKPINISILKEMRNIICKANSLAEELMKPKQFSQWRYQSQVIICLYSIRYFCRYCKDKFIQVMNT